MKPIVERALELNQFAFARGDRIMEPRHACKRIFPAAVKRSKLTFSAARKWRNWQTHQT